MERSKIGVGQRTRDACHDSTFHVPVTGLFSKNLVQYVGVTIETRAARRQMANRIVREVALFGIFCF